MTEAQPDQDVLNYIHWAVQTGLGGRGEGGVSLVHEFRFKPQQQLLLMNKPEPVHHEAILRSICGERHRWG